MRSRYIDSKKLIKRMEKHNLDRAYELKSLDEVYDLAISDMKKEIDALSEVNVVPEYQIRSLMKAIAKKECMHEYGGFKINRLSIKEVLKMISEYTGIVMEDGKKRCVMILINQKD